MLGLDSSFDVSLDVFSIEDEEIYPRNPRALKSLLVLSPPHPPIISDASTFVKHVLSKLK